MGGGDTKTTTPKTATQMLNEELKDPSSVQSYRIPCETALMIYRWMPTKLVDHLTAKLVDRLTAKLMNRLTAVLVKFLTVKLMNHLTAKLS